jgi:hypothetical protein
VLDSGVHEHRLPFDVDMSIMGEPADVGNPTTGRCLRSAAAGCHGPRGPVDVSVQPDEHHVGPPASETELAVLRERLPWVPDDLVTLHREVAPVWLPDIDNGYFLHAVGLMVGADLRDFSPGCWARWRRSPTGESRNRGQLRLHPNGTRSAPKMTG